MRYANFDVRIRRGTPYQVRVTSPGGEAHGTFHVPPELKALLPKRPAGKRSRRHVVVDAVDAAPGRIGLLLRDPSRDQPLALSVRTPIVRYLELPEPAPPIPADPPLRVLVVGANPSDVCRLDLPRESLLVHRARSPGPQSLAGGGHGIHQAAERKEKGNFYRLPTEAEWEYAARAGSRKHYSFGNDDTVLPLYGNCLSRGGNDRFDSPAPAGSFKPNAWGLYDMHGNVWEWVADWYGEYGAAPVRDPVGPSSGERRVRRGGSWKSRPENCWSASRSSSKPGTRDQEIGFRLVREIR